MTFASDLQRKWFFATLGERAAPEFKTVAEAERWARETLGVSVSYGKHLEAANRINDALAIARARGVALPSRIIIESSKGDLGGTHLALYSVSTDSITIDPKYWSRSETASEGFFSTRNPQHVILHEFGHMEHFRSVPDRYDALGSFRFSDAVATEMKKSVSRYGASSGLEFIAEVYAGLMTGKKYDETVMRWYTALGGVVR